MLISCSGCNSKIRVPDSAAGKRVKCPKCATLVRVPEAENPSEGAEPEATGVSSKPMPAAPPPLPAESETQETADPEAFSETSSSGGSKPPPIKSKRASSIDDDDDDDEPPQKKGRKYDDEEDEDSDEIDVRRRGSRGGGRPVNGMAMTSMITGVAAVAVGVPGCLFCCCGLFTGIAAVAGTVAVILGYMSKDSPGSESYSKTGIICGSVAIVQALIGIIYFILSITLRFGMLGMHNF